jgi:hypothetical protein
MANNSWSEKSTALQPEDAEIIQQRMTSVDIGQSIVSMINKKRTNFQRITLAYSHDALVCHAGYVFNENQQHLFDN